MSKKKNTAKIINLGFVIAVLKKYRRLYFKVWPIVFILSCLWILPEPRFYTSEVMIAPELGNESAAAGGLSSLASSFGINIGGANNDAIYPMLYPELFSSTEFIVKLMSIRLKVDLEDGPIDTDYYTYLARYQKRNVIKGSISDGIRYVKGLIIPDDDNKDATSGETAALDPFRLSKFDFKLVEAVSGLITCSVDRKTDVATITVKDQNAVVAALLADSVKCRLQEFITDYRTAKARKDFEYYTALADSSYKEYEDAAVKYVLYADSHQNSILQASTSKRTDLENDMNQKYEAYTTMVAQKLMAKAKVQERTPAFITLKNATVPVKPAGPKRMIFIALMLILSTMGVFVYSVRDLILDDGAEDEGEESDAIVKGQEV